MCLFFWEGPVFEKKNLPKKGAAALINTKYLNYEFSIWIVSV